MQYARLKRLLLILFALLLVPSLPAYGQEGVSANPGTVPPGAGFTVTVTTGQPGVVSCTYSTGGFAFGSPQTGFAPNAYNSDVTVTCYADANYIGSTTVTTFGDPLYTDSDGDGFVDAVDICAQEYSPNSSNGCGATNQGGAGNGIIGPPGDPDNDGVGNNEDNCDDQPGPLDNNGCPVNTPPPPQSVDSDGDSVVDIADKCPGTTGSPDHEGCPVPLIRFTPFKESGGCQVQPRLNSTDIYPQPEVRGSLGNIDRGNNYLVLASAIRTRADGKEVRWYLVNNGRYYNNSSVLVNEAAASPTGWVSETEVIPSPSCGDGTVLLLPNNCPTAVLNHMLKASEAVRSNFNGLPNPCESYVNWLHTQEPNDLITAVIPDMDNLISECPEVLPEFIQLAYHYERLLPEQHEALLGFLNGKMTDATVGCAMITALVRDKVLPLDLIVTDRELAEEALIGVCNPGLQPQYHIKVSKALDAIDPLDAIDLAKQPEACQIINYLVLIGGVGTAQDDILREVYDRFRQCTPPISEAQALKNITLLAGIYATDDFIRLAILPAPNFCTDFEQVLKDVNLTERRDDLMQDIPLQLRDCRFVVSAIFVLRHKDRLLDEILLDRLVSHPDPCRVVTNYLTTGYIPPYKPTIITFYWELERGNAKRACLGVGNVNNVTEIFQPNVGIVYKDVTRQCLMYNAPEVGTFVFYYTIGNPAELGSKTYRVIVTVKSVASPRVTVPVQCIPNRTCSFTVPVSGQQCPPERIFDGKVKRLNPSTLTTPCLYDDIPTEVGTTEICTEEIDGQKFCAEQDTQEIPDLIDIVLPLPAAGILATFRAQTSSNAPGDIFVLIDGVPYRLTTTPTDENRPVIHIGGGTVEYFGAEIAGELANNIWRHEYTYTDTVEPFVPDSRPQLPLTGDGVISVGTLDQESNLAISPDGRYLLVPVKVGDQVNLHRLPISRLSVLDDVPLIENAKNPVFDEAGGVVLFERDNHIWQTTISNLTAGEAINISAGAPDLAAGARCFGASFGYGFEIYFTCTTPGGNPVVYRYNDLGELEDVENATDKCDQVEFKTEAPKYFVCTKGEGSQSIPVLFHESLSVQYELVFPGMGGFTLSQFDWPRVPR